MSQPNKNDHVDKVSDAISRVLIPVMICMMLSVWFVHSLGDVGKCDGTDKEKKLATILVKPPKPEELSSTQISGLLAGIFVLIFIVLVVVFTFLMVWLYKSGKRKIIQVWLVVSVFLILSYVGGVYIFDFFRSRCIDIDWFTLVIAIWNFSITGLFAVFGRVPRFVNQAYLIIISSLMAYIFRTLPDFAVWIILGLLVVWDLFAVLSKFGPLKLLVDAAKERDDDLPALVYDTNPVAPGREHKGKSSKASATQKKKRKQTISSQPLPSEDPLTQSNQLPPPPSTANAPSSLKTSATDSSAPSQSLNAGSTSQSNAQKPHRNLKTLFRRGSKNKPANDGNGENNDNGQTATAEGDGRDNNSENNAQATTGNNRKNVIPIDADGEVQVGTLGTHLKLGLGDFVFYSILVAQASRSGPMATIASFIAILAGLCATLFLVTVMRQPLPALPISITAGLVIFFLTRYSLLPYAENLLPRLLFH